MKRPAFRFRSFGAVWVLLVLAGCLVWAACRPASLPPTYLPCGSASEKAVPIPYHRQPYALASGVQSSAGLQEVTPFSQTVYVPAAAWLRLHFGDYELGAQSYILISSVEDGSQQRFDAVSLPQWNNSSAFFNGDAVVVELHVAPGEEGVFFQIAELSVGERASESELSVFSPQGSLGPASVCGSDNRVSSSDPAVGRIVPVGCTGWIVANGAHLTAGHCAGTDMDIIEFNVPPSDPDGTINHPAAQHQYPIGASSIVFHANGVGDDWTIFAVSPNATTHLLPVQAQGAFHRVALPADMNPSQVGATGYGVDGPAPCYGDSRQYGCGIPAPTPVPRNSDSQTQQTDRGPYIGQTVVDASHVYFTYRADDQGGDSGAPVISATTTMSMGIGIQTNGGCSNPDFGNVNSATSFANDDLALALRRFPGWPMIYVDNGHLAGTVSGDILRPWPSVGLANYFATGGETISIVKGSYDEAITITKALTLTAPVGMVTIGQ